MNEVIQGIYKITNLINNKVYIGSSKNIYNRINRHHKSYLRNNNHWNIHLQNAWNKYGGEKFKFEIIEVVDNEGSLKSREQYWMDFYKASNREYGYNIAPRADRTIHSDETKRKMSISRRGKAPIPPGWHHTNEAKKKISEAGKKRKGIKLSEETKEKLRRINIGKKASKETRQKIREAHKRGCYKHVYEERKGIKLSLETRRKMSLAHKNCIQTEMKRMKCSTSKLREKNPNYKPVSDSIANIIRLLYVQNKTVAAISRQVGYSRYKIKRFLIEDNLMKGKVTWMTSRWS